MKREMHMTAGEICVRDVVVATRDTTVTEAAKLMRQQHVGSLVIVDRTEEGLRVPLGIVTDRDIVIEVTATELDPATITVGDIMPAEVVTVRGDADVHDALQVMRRKGVRRLPVVTGDGRLIGLVALDDLLEHVAAELSELIKVIEREQAREAKARRSYAPA